jgi:hypothetical protein
MLNNPIFWADPDGRTEYETIIFKNEKTGQLIKVYRSVSTKLMTDGAVCKYQIDHQHYYDYRHVTTYTLTTNGEVIVDRSTEILKRNGVKYQDRVPMDNLFGTVAEEGAIYDPEDKWLQAGGFYMTGSNGQGTKFHSKNADYVGNIDMLVSILSNYSASGKFKVNDKGLANQQAWDGVQDIMDLLSDNLGSIGKVEELVEEIRKVVKSNSSSGSADYDSGSDPVVIMEPSNQAPINGEKQYTKSTQSRKDAETYNGTYNKSRDTLWVKPDK